MSQDEDTQNHAVELEITWWAEDGSERRGRISLASGASSETAAALARLLRLADTAASEEESPQPPNSCIARAYSTA